MGLDILVKNATIGGAATYSGKGYGGGIFNLNGFILVWNLNAASNLTGTPYGTATAGPDAYNLSLNAGNTASGQTPNASIAIYASANPPNVVNNQVDGSGIVSNQGVPGIASLTGAGLQTDSNGFNTLDFGGAPVNCTNCTQTLNIFNSGTLMVVYSLQTIPAFDFSVSDSYCSRINGTIIIGAQGTCSIRVGFSPTREGRAAGVLVITDSALDSPQIVFLSGTARRP
jgi:hypothetical protein